MKRAIVLGCLIALWLCLLWGCVDMSGNAWIDSEEAATVSQILGWFFFGFLSILIFWNRKWLR
jgi:hypothetical protein